MKCASDTFVCVAFYLPEFWILGYNNFVTCFISHGHVYLYTSVGKSIKCLRLHLIFTTSCLIKSYPKIKLKTYIFFKNLSYVYILLLMF